MTEVLGFIGLGAMGSQMVARLLAAGHRVHVHDVNAQAVAAAVALGAVGCDSPAAVANAAPVVLVSLPTPDVVKQVALGPKGLIEGNAIQVYIDLSTTGASMAQKVAAGLAPRQVSSLDAPVSGGVAGAKAGTLAVMVSGSSATFERVRPVLEVIGSNTIHVGPGIGQGQTLKLVNNLLAATTYAATCEVLVMGAKAGIDPDVMTRVINASSGRSFPTEKFVPGPVLNRSFDFGFRMALMLKDVKLALSEAEALGLTMMTCTAGKQLLAHAMAHSDPGADITEMIKTTEEWGGATVAARQGRNGA